MLGLVTIGFTLIMIYTLVKNALVGTQLNRKDTYPGTVELIIPITADSEFYLDPWMKNLSNFHSLSGRVRIHILIDGHHPAVNAWQELHHKLPYVEIHSFLMRPLGRKAVPWMIEQIAPKINGQVVIIGDAELVPTEQAFISIGHIVSQKNRPYFILPQTIKTSLLGEAVAVLNPTLALASVFGFRKMRRNISHPLVSIAQGWMGMPLDTFQAFDWGKINIPSWKEAMSKEWDIENRSYLLAFGEKQLMRHYPENFKVQVHQLRIYWGELWSKGERAGLGLYVVALLIWSFPVICLLTHPIWAIISIGLLAIYRFFTKIVFQESLTAIILHPFGCIIWLGTFIWWLTTGLKTKYRSKMSA